MFEIPDDDENFWEELPLEDITNSKHQSENRERFTCGVKRLSSESADHDLTKRFRSGNLKSSECEVINTSSHCSKKLRTQIVESPACKVSDKDIPRTPILHQGHPELPKSHFYNSNNVYTTPTSLRPAEGRVPAVSQHIVGQEKSEPVKDLLGRVKTRTQHDSNSQTPARTRRKFPGPAGLLPKISPGNIKDNTCMTKQSISTSPEVVRQVDDSVILSSQSGEEVFNDTPWQTLLRDLGEDGRKLINQYSIATSLQKTRKKLLPKGKVPLVLALIESVDWQGSDASICLKDKSGKIHGTVHHSLMKDHQCDFQPGTAIVLRQVSMISPSSRNHYLNVTPSNIVAIYSNSSNGLRMVKNYTKDIPLSSALSNVEPYLVEESNVRRLSGLGTPITPLAGVGQRLRLSSPQTPIATPTHGQRPPLSTTALRPTFTPRQVPVCSSSVRTPQHIKPVNSPLVPGQRPTFMSGPIANSNVGASGPSFRTPQPSVTQTPQRLPSSHKFKFVKTPSIGNGVNSAASSPSHNSAVNMLQSNDHGMNYNKPVVNTLGFDRDNGQTVSSLSSMNSAQKPSFNRNLYSTNFASNGVSEPANTNSNTASNHVPLRPPQIPTCAETTRSYEPTSITTPSNGSAKKSFKFKPSKTNISPECSLPGISTSSSSHGNMLKTLKEPPRPCLEADTLWQDDLSDDLLSQLSEEMM